MFHHISNWYMAGALGFVACFVAWLCITARVWWRETRQPNEWSAAAPPSEQRAAPEIDWSALDRHLFAMRGERIVAANSRIAELERDNARLTRKLAKARKSRDGYQRDAKHWRRNYGTASQETAAAFAHGVERGRSEKRRAGAPTHE